MPTSRRKWIAKGSLRRQGLRKLDDNIRWFKVSTYLTPLFSSAEDYIRSWRET
ncbi:MAG: hypothetical protein H0T46_14420 [Deltaproteobacteria bacterium]|nr:hypothetical protein [Deltaproteobacteria bacterium]